MTAAEALEHPWLVGTTATDTPLVRSRLLRCALNNVSVTQVSVLANLKQFNGNNKFKTGLKFGVYFSADLFDGAAVLNLMTDYLGPDELASLKVTRLFSDGGLYRTCSVRNPLLRSTRMVMAPSRSQSSRRRLPSQQRATLATAPDARSSIFQGCHV